jgi:hypothetical protein
MLLMLHRVLCLKTAKDALLCSKVSNWDSLLSEIHFIITGFSAIAQRQMKG